MTKQEYENLTNTTVSFEDYKNIIEPMYMATDLSKADFVKTIDTARFDRTAEKELKLVLVNVPYEYFIDDYLRKEYLVKFVGVNTENGKVIIETLDVDNYQELYDDVLNGRRYTITNDNYVLDIEECCSKSGRKLGKAFYKKLARIAGKETPKFF